MDTCLVVSETVQKDYHFSRFRLAHVAQSAASILCGDVCKQTCKTPVPDTCKLECHSGSPFTDMCEEIPEAIMC